MDEYEHTLLARLTRPKRPGLVRITYAMLELERGARCKASLGESCNHAACILMCALRTFWSTTAAKGTQMHPHF